MAHYPPSELEDLKASAQEELIDGLLTAQLSDKCCDLTLKCGDLSWKVHRIVVCTRSKFLQRACEGGFKEGATGIIDLKDDDPDAIMSMVYWFYNCDYELGATNGTSTLDARQHSIDTVDPLIAHLNIYVLADKYGIRLLKELAKRKFSAILHEHRVRANDHWTQMCFPKIVEKVYDATMASDCGLRACLLPMIKDYWALLRAEAVFMGLVKNLEDLAVDIIDAWASESGILTNNVAAGYGHVLHWCTACKTNKIVDLHSNGNWGRCRSCQHQVRIHEWGVGAYQVDPEGYSTY